MLFVKLSSKDGRNSSGGLYWNGPMTVKGLWCDNSDVHLPKKLDFSEVNMKSCAAIRLKYCPKIAPEELKKSFQLGRQTFKYKARFCS